MSQQAMTNGDSAKQSKFISHATSYPVVSDTIDAVTNNPYGKKSLEMADGAYQKYGKQVEPYLETPYSYVKPYVQKADELADAGLGKVDERFPIVKEDTHTLYDTAVSYAFSPYTYVKGTYDDEYNKTASHNNRGPGVTTFVMAVVSTELKIASDFFQTIADFLGPKYEESKKKGADYVKQAEQTAGKYKQIGEEKYNEFASDPQGKADEAMQKGQQKADEYTKYGQQKTDEAMKTGQQKTDEYTKYGQQKADEAKKTGQQKTDEYTKYGQQKADEAKGQAEGAKQEAQKKTSK